MFKVKDFIKVLNLNNKGGKIYKEIEKEIVDLQSKPVTYIDEYEVRHRISWFSYTAYYDTTSIRNINTKKQLNLEEEPFFVVRFTEEISNFLTSLENYVRYNFFISHILKSIHSIRIYELLQSYRNTKSQRKKYVLEKAKEELNAKLNLGFNFEIDKTKITLKANKNDDDLFKEIFNIDNFEKSKKEEKEIAYTDKIQSNFFTL